MTQPQISNGEDGTSVRGKLNTILRGEFQVVIDYLGSELVTDGDLSTDPALSGWTLTDATWSAGQIQATYDGGNNPIIRVPVTVEAGADYLVALSFSAMDGDYIHVSFNNGSIDTAIANAGNSVVLYAAPSDGADAVYIFPGEYVTDATFTLTSISVRKVEDPDEPLTLLDAAGVRLLNIAAYGDNINIGRTAGENVDDSGYSNINIGALSGFHLGAAFQNINLGYKAGFTNVSGSNNMNIGQYAGYWSLNKSENTNVGYSAGYGAVGGATGEKNTNIGAHAGFKLSTGSNNTNIGRNAGNLITSGGFNICIGDNAQVPDPTNNNQISIGGIFQYNGNSLASIGTPIALAGGTPASASDSGVAGTVLWDDSFVYVCVATDTWKRAAISTW